MSGVVPMVAAILGHCAAGTAYIPGLAISSDGEGHVVDGSRWSTPREGGGRRGRDEEEMGGSAVHTRVSGCADFEVADDRECLAVVKEYLSFLPVQQPRGPPIRPTGDPADRLVPEL